MRFKSILLFLAANLLVHPLSWAKNSHEKHWSEVQPECHEQWDRLPREKWDRIPETKGVVKYALTSRLMATQAEFAYGKYQDSEEKHILKHEVEQDGKTGEYKFSNQKGNKSLYPTSSAISVISYQGELYIVDGHHRALLSVCKGAPMVPVKIEYDFSDLNRTQFLQELERLHDKKKFFLHREAGGEPVFIPVWQMRDNPYLYLIRQVTRNVRYNEETDKVEKTTDADPFLILKINRGLPGQEFYKAKIARKVLPNYKTGDKVSKDDLKTLGKAFAEDGRPGDEDAWRFQVMAEPTSADDEKIEKWIRREHKECAKALRKEVSKDKKDE